ncbi:hypothetical protein VN97_g3086 [Penicillium thymicola]|uniref:Uncharacterized protein n=1 Tax=Penicillium thymicola TaxID=293382 RepID=A0AAI9XAJ6_PENTH|nr:hypothetical protein VN97_g3086 [Penicillium thymicola]
MVPLVAITNFLHRRNPVVKFGPNRLPYPHTSQGISDIKTAWDPVVLIQTHHSYPIYPSQLQIPHPQNMSSNNEVHETDEHLEQRWFLIELEEAIVALDEHKLDAT